jgi:hypothetical protein
MRWAFFVDANLEPTVSDLLEDEGSRAESADYVLDEDADDEDDSLERGMEDHEQGVVTPRNLRQGPCQTRMHATLVQNGPDTVAEAVQGGLARRMHGE